MGLKEDLTQEIESMRQKFHHLLDSVPEALYVQPSDNPARNIGEIQRNERGNPRPAGQRINRQRLIKAYEAGHAGLMFSLKRMWE